MRDLREVAASVVLDLRREGRVRGMTRVLVITGAAALFLSAAATIRLVYSIPPSYLLVGVACVAGAPIVFRGWRRFPPAVVASASLLLLAYLVAAAAADPASLPDNPRAGTERILVYVVDLCLGLAAVGLIGGLWPDAGSARPLVVALVAGAALGGAYATYQWFAQRFGLPLRDVNNTLSSNGVTADTFQGTGILGWERARGTFIEPHYLAVYLASIAPLALGLAAETRARARTAAAGAAVLILAGLAVTSSAPPGVLLAVAAIGAAAVWLAAAGRPIAAAAAGGLLAVALVAAPLTIASPRLLADVTGRSEAVISQTTSARTESWHRAILIWQQRPVIGFGPGQSSVQLAANRDRPAAERPPASNVLQSAEGLWAASLIDGGVLALGAWMLFFVAVVAAGAAAVKRRPTIAGVAALLAAVVAIANAETSGDRVELFVWMVLAVLLLSTRRHPEEEKRNQAHR